jgi:hypothetical protein
MNKADLTILDEMLAHQINLERFTAGERKKVLAILDALQKELRVKLMGDLTDFGKARVNKLLSESTAIIEAAYKEIAPGVKSAPKPWDDAMEHLNAKQVKIDQWKALIASGKGDDIKAVRKIDGSDSRLVTAQEGIDEFNELIRRDSAYIASKYPDAFKQPKSTDLLGLARHEAIATASTFATIGLEATIPTEAVLRALVNGSLIEGHAAGAWWAKQSDDLAFKFASQVRQGIAAGETLMDIVRRVAGSPKLGIPGIMEVSRRNAGALVHTSIMQVANDARMAVYKANEDISKGYMHLSTLDGSVCPVCVARSGAQWDLEYKPIGGTKVQFQQTPIHFRCRCLVLPILKSYRELGANIEEPPTGTRASDEGQVRADITMTEWLKGKPKSYVDDLLGPGRAKLWQDGKITLQDLVSQNGRPLTLEQLRGKK